MTVISSDIVACARTWVGTRFHHQGRLKKTDTHRGGVDCLGLLVGIARELELKHADGRMLADFDELDYTHLPDAGRLKRSLTRFFTEVDADQIRAGDILLLALSGNPQHLAVVSDGEDGLHIVHAYAQARQVVEHALDGFWIKRITGVYRL